MNNEIKYYENLNKVDIEELDDWFKLYIKEHKQELLHDKLILVEYGFKDSTYYIYIAMNDEFKIKFLFYKDDRFIAAKFVNNKNFNGCDIRFIDILIRFKKIVKKKMVIELDKKQKEFNKSNPSIITEMEYVNFRIQSKLFTAYEELNKNKIPVRKTLIIKTSKLPSTDAYLFKSLLETLVSGNKELIAKERIADKNRCMQMKQYEQNKKSEYEERENRTLQAIERFRNGNKRITKSEVACLAQVSVDQINKSEMLLKKFNEVKNELDKKYGFNIKKKDRNKNTVPDLKALVKH